MEKFIHKASCAISYVGKVVSFYHKEDDESEGVIVVKNNSGNKCVGRYDAKYGCLTIFRKIGSEFVQWNCNYKNYESAAPVIALYF